MRLLFLGDVVGRSAEMRFWISSRDFRDRYSLDFVVVNGENAAAGFGITEDLCNKLLDAGADVITTGNHVWDQRETLGVYRTSTAAVASSQLSERRAGAWRRFIRSENGQEVLVINAMGACL